MTSTPERAVGTEGEEPAGSPADAPRRIPIGSQRPGAAPPKAPPRHRYVSTPPATATSPAASVGQTVTATDTPTSPAAAAQAVTQQAVTQQAVPPMAKPGGGDAAGRKGPGREKRGGPARNPLTDVLPPQRRIAVPNPRSALEEDLESDFEAALAGVSIDDLLGGSAVTNAEAALEPGARITGTVLSIGADTAFIDLGGRRQGALKLAGLLDQGGDLPIVGQVLELSVGTRSEEDGLYEVAPANRAVSVDDWSQLEAGMIVEARVTGSNKGGLECEVAGLRGFMPTSLISPWRIENPAELVGQTLESLVTEIVPAARRLVLSRRAVIERQASDARAAMLETLEVGATIEGLVRSVRDFGAFVDIGNGVEGLIHVSQLSWDRVENPAEVLQPGQKVRVVVKKIDRQTGKIGLSARDLVESPWKHAAEKYHVGATVRGRVSRIAQFGAFVRLEPGVEGLVHVSEIATRHIRSVADAVKEGEEVECRVLAVDPDEQRMSLSIKALAAAPAREAADEPAEASPPSAPKRPSRSGPLKGGLGGQSAGERFGLKW